MSFPRYPTYKDSGVEWLGVVPGHWAPTPIKHLGRLKGGAGFPHEKQGVEGEALSFHKVNALAQADSEGFLSPSDNTISLDTAKELGAFIFPPSTVVFAKVGAALLLGRIRLLNHDACLDNNMMGLVVRKDQFHVKFVRYAMNLVRFDLIANPGAVPSLNEGQIGDFQLVMPPLTEQVQIATFLDRETAKIDGLVAEQRRLMELLKEKRQAVISHAVTQGLNPHAPMKPSGVEWLGDVPEHWTVIALKRIADVQTGVAKGKNHGSRNTISVPYLRVANVQDGYLNLETIATMDIPKEDLQRYALQPGDVLMNEGGDFDKLGRGHVWDGQIEPCITQNHVFAVRPRKVTSAWLNAITSSDFAQFYFMTRSKQSTNLASISSTNLMELPVILPPKNEQIEILAFIADQTVRFDTLTAEAQRAIDLLQERRTALVSAAVTGQIDVRGLAAVATH